MPVAIDPTPVLSGAVGNADELIALLRCRKDALEFSDLTVDEIAGFQSGYTSKIIGPARTKGMSLFTMFALCSALGLSLTLVDDPRARRRFVDRAPRRASPPRQPNVLKRLRTEQRDAILKIVSWSTLRRAVLSEIACRGAEARAQGRRDKISRKQRKRIAQTAARARWADRHVD